MAKKENIQDVQNEKEQNQETSQQEEHIQDLQETQLVEQHQENMEQPEEKAEDETLYSFYELVNKHRLATWQVAAILKLLNKEDDIHLTEQEFLLALNELSFRKMGAR